MGAASQPLRVRHDLVLPAEELRYEFTRSGGPGGQHVNKVESCVLLRFDLERSPSLDEAQRARLRAKLGRKLTAGGEVLVRSESHRRREQNLREARERLAELLRGGLLVPRRRTRTKPTRGSVRRRLEAKRRHGEKKRARRGDE